MRLAAVVVLFVNLVAIVVVAAEDSDEEASGLEAFKQALILNDGGDDVVVSNRTKSSSNRSSESNEDVDDVGTLTNRTHSKKSSNTSSASNEDDDDSEMHVFSNRTQPKTSTKTKSKPKKSDNDVAKKSEKSDTIVGKFNNSDYYDEEEDYNDFVGTNSNGTHKKNGTDQDSLDTNSTSKTTTKSIPRPPSFTAASFFTQPGQIEQSMKIEEEEGRLSVGLAVGLLVVGVLYGAFRFWQSRRAQNNAYSAY